MIISPACLFRKTKESQKKVLKATFHNKRPVGKPRTRWEDVVRRDTSQILGIRGWKETNRRLRRIEASSEGRQGPRRGCRAIDEWMVLYWSRSVLDVRFQKIYNKQCDMVVTFSLHS
jgi:hypothetical protein